ncbi:MAG: hypothetical protein FJW22_02900 [Acidimicrobiia bacterium]|nr:hypothetical protein [Acidimicrobiia bacterium]
MFKIQDFMIPGAAFISWLFSVSPWFGAFWPPNREAGIFVGLWVPSILAAGIFLQLLRTARQ